MAFPCPSHALPMSFPCPSHFPFPCPSHAHFLSFPCPVLFHTRAHIAAQNTRDPHIALHANAAHARPSHRPWARPHVRWVGRAPAAPSPRPPSALGPRRLRGNGLDDDAKRALQAAA